MFIDYQTQVSRDYERKKAANMLSLRLTFPTPAKIKEECIVVCTERYRPADENALRSFFEKRDSPTDYIKAIKKLHPDKFRPLVNYLKNPKINTDEKNVELLAWLIDFKPRPFQLGIPIEIPAPESKAVLIQETPGEVGLVEEEKKMIEETTLPEKERDREIVEMKPIPEPIGMPQVTPRRKIFKPSTIKKSIVVIAALLILLSTGYGVFQGIYDPMSGKEGCMYWAGDHYVQVPCIQRFRDTVVVALDTFKLHNFKKITQPDTITLQSAGKIWYLKKDNEIEYFTAKGCHPVYQQRRLKPLSELIIKKYILHN